jgi:hypothetical protein
MRLSRVAVLLPAIVAAVVASPFASGVAVADGPSTCSSPASPIVVHPGRDRFFWLSCSPDSPTSVAVDPPDYGEAEQGTTLLYLYHPAPGYLGADHLTLRPSGPAGAWAPVGYDFDVTDAVNTAPACSIGSSGRVRAGETRAVHFAACDDPEGDPATYAIVTPPAHGTVGAPTVHNDSMGTSASYAYTADPGYTGPDTFTYRATDDHGGASNVATATITVDDAVANQAPVCVDFGNLPPGFGTIVHGPTNLAGGCSDWDGDAFTVAIVTPTAHGTLTVAADGRTLDFVPDAGYAGTDTYAFTASDDHGGTTQTQTRTIQIGPNHAPVCTDATTPVAHRATAAAKPTILALPCTDDDHDQLAPTIDAAPTHGQLTFDSPRQQFTYRADPGYSGTDTATFRVDDGHGATSGAARTLTFTVAAASAAPGGTDPVAGTGTTADTPPKTTIQPATTQLAMTPPAPAAVQGNRPLAATAWSQAAALLHGTPKALDLGLGAAARAFTTTAKSVAPGAPLAVVICPSRCTVAIDGRLATGGRSSKLGHRALTITGARPGLVKLQLTRTQRARLAKARRATLVLKLTVASGGRSKKTGGTFTIRP